jgi:hypothetical protein
MAPKKAAISPNNLQTTIRESNKPVVVCDNA